MVECNGLFGKAFKLIAFVIPGMFYISQLVPVKTGKDKEDLPCAPARTQECYPWNFRRFPDDIIWDKNWWYWGSKWDQGSSLMNIDDNKGFLKTWGAGLTKWAYIIFFYIMQLWSIYWYLFIHAFLCELIYASVFTQPNRLTAHPSAHQLVSRP